MFIMLEKKIENLEKFNISKNCSRVIDFNFQ
jgi:hypothetical protein